MKTITKFYYSLLLLCITTGIIFQACKKEKSETQNPNATVNFNQIAFAEVPGLDESHFYEVNYTERKKAIAFQTAATWLTAKDFKHFTNLFPQLDNVAAVIVYLNDKPDQVKAFSHNNVTGFSVLVNENEAIYHHLFRNTGKGFKEDKEYNIEANDINTTQTDFVCYEVLGHQSKGWWYICNKENKDYKELKTRNEFFIKMAAYRIKHKNRDDETAEAAAPPGGGGGGGGTGCGSYPGCEYGMPFTYCDMKPFTDGMYGCDAPGGTCPVMYVYDEVEDTYDPHQLQMMFNFPLMYEFKDFLTESPRGLDMLYYYYAIGNYITDVPYSMAADAVMLLPSITSRMDMLVHNTAPGEPLTSHDIALQWTNFLNTVKSLNEDPDYQIVVDAVITEINFLAGKSVHEVREIYH